MIRTPAPPLALLRPAPALFALLAPALPGCDGAGLDPVAGFDTATATASPVRIERLDPDWGSPEGGTSVDITGDGFEGDVRVEIGGKPVDHTRLDDRTLLITTPPADFPVAVDVYVRSDLGEATLPGGFTYADEEPPDTGTTPDDTGTGATATGLVGGVIEMSFFAYACPECYGLASQTSIYAAAQLHEPAQGSWLGWAPATGQCTLNPAPTLPTADSLDAGDWIYLDSGSTSVGLRKQLDGRDVTYDSGELSSNDFLKSAQYRLTVPGGSDLPAFDLPNALQTPQGFDAISPEGMLNIGAQYAFTERISRSGERVSWSPSGGNGTVIVLVDVYRSDGAAYLGNIYCVAADNGAMTIPGGYLGQFNNGSLLSITVARNQESASVRPTDGATIESTAKLGVVGTGVLGN